MRNSSFATKNSAHLSEVKGWKINHVLFAVTLAFVIVAATGLMVGFLVSVGAQGRMRILPPKQVPAEKSDTVKLKPITFVRGRTEIAAKQSLPSGQTATTHYVDPGGVCGGNSPCYTTIQAAINAASSGDTISVFPGTYAEQIDINKALTVLGPNANINPNTGARVAEAVIIPTASNPIDPDFNGPIVVSLRVSGVTFKGFTVDGDNPSLTSGIAYNGADVDAEFGIYGTETSNPDAVISNNIVKNIGEIAVWLNSFNAAGGARNDNSQISANKVDNCFGPFGQGIRISDNAWLSILNNVVTRVRVGIVIENYSSNVTHPASVISNNNVSAFRIGIRHNLHYAYGAPGFTIANNTVASYVQSVRPPAVVAAELPVTAYQGIRVESVQQTVFVKVFENTLTGNRAALGAAGYTRAEGLMLTNASNTSPNILFRGNSATDFIRGAFNETPAVPDFECNNFAGNTTGVYLSSSATGGLIAHNNNIAGNGFGMQNDGPAAVNAQANWWGAPNGPGPVGPGSGDNVSTGVDFSNWLTSSSNCPPPCPTNVARASFGATAFASTEYSASYPASSVIDGEHDGNNWGAGGGWNDGTFSSFPDTVGVNLNITQTIDAINVYTLKDDFNSGSTVGDFTTFSFYGITDFEVQYWNGSSWVTVPGGSVTGNNRVKRSFTFASPIATDKLRVIVNASLDGQYSRVVEIEAYSCAPVVVPPSPTPTPTPPTCVSPGNNVALASNGATAVASSTINASYPASSVIDGEHDGNSWGSMGGWNDGTFTFFPDNVQVNFGGPQNITEIDVYTLKDDVNSGSTVNDSTTFTFYGITNFNVQYWTGSAWVDVPGGAVTGNNKVKRSFIFAGIATDRVRVVVNSSADGQYSRVVEIEAYTCDPPVLPTPCTSPSNNVARAANGSTAIASSSLNASYPALGAIDGEHDGNNWGAGGGWNDGTYTVFPDSLEVDFNVAQTISEIDVYTLKNDFNSGSTVNDSTTFLFYGITSFNVQYWTGSAWNNVTGGAITGNNLVKRKVIFSPLTTDKIRVVVNASVDNQYSRVVELEAFSCNPVPVLCVNNGGTGGCFSTIQAAINAASPGSAINVAAGTYNENLTLNKRLLLRGAQAGINACGRSSSESIITAASGILLNLQTGSAGSVIDGFTFSGGVRGISSTSGPIDNLQILNNRFVGFTNNGASLNHTGTDITINQNSVDGSSKLGGGGLVQLSADAFNGFRLTNNCIVNGFATATGFLVDGNRNVGSSAARSPLISGNLFNHIRTGANIGQRSISNATISDNTFSNNDFDGLQGGPRNSLISGNMFSNNGRNGLSLTHFGNPTADLTQGASLSTITCNTFTGNGLTNNVGGTIGGAIAFSANQAPGTISSNHTNFNNISGNLVGARYTGTEIIDAENNWWGSATGPTIATNGGGSGDIIADTNNKIDYTPFLTSAATCANLVVSPADEQGWLAQVSSANGLAQFVSSPPAPLYGVGSLRLFTGTEGDQSAEFRNSNYDGTSLSALTGMGYCTYVTQWNGSQAPYLILRVDQDNNGSVDDLLFFEPEYSRGTYNPSIPVQPAPALNTWQCWQALRGGWYGIDATTFNPSFGGPGAGVLPFSSYTATYPSAVLRNASGGAVRLVSGFASPGDVFNSNNDIFRIGVGSNQTIYNFEPGP